MPKGQYLIKKMAQNSHVAQEIFSQKDSTRVRPREQRTVTHKCCAAGGWGCSQLPHLEVMFTHAMDSKRQASYTATVFIKRESSQLQPGHTSLFPISVNEWEYFILNGTWRIKVQPEGFNFVLWTSTQQLLLKKNSQEHVELTEQKAEWVFKSLHFSSLWKQMS